MYRANPNRIARPQPVVVRPAFMTFYPPLEISQLSLQTCLRRPGEDFFIHPLKAKPIFTTAQQQKQTGHIIKETAISLNPRQGECMGSYIIIILLYIQEEGAKRLGDEGDICMRKYAETQLRWGRKSTRAHTHTHTDLASGFTSNFS